MTTEEREAWEGMARCIREILSAATIPNLLNGEENDTEIRTETGALHSRPTNA